MSKGSLSSTGLGRLHDTLAGHVEAGTVPGLVAAVARGDDLYVEAFGTNAVGGAEPMRLDTIFRISSMTKPVTAVATMILAEEGTVGLDDPVDRWLPELANRRVLRDIDGPLDDTVPAQRSITVRDLLTLRMGFGNYFAPIETTPILQAELEHELRTLNAPKPATPHAPDEWMRRLGELPLMQQPGEQWMYSTGSHVLGVLVARASGQPLEAFWRERIFDPLGMDDTALSVPAGKLDRLSSSYVVDQETGALRLVDGVDDSQWSRPPVFPDAGGGLVSTVDDYLAFGRMLLHHGTLGKARVLSRPSVEMMTSNHIAPHQRTFADVFLESQGWGFGVSMPPTPGPFGWDGGLGTSWKTDPTEDLVAILMTQRWLSAGPLTLNADFWTGVYQALDD